MNDRDHEALIQRVNQLGEAVQRFDDQAARDDDPVVDAMRDAAHELHYYVVSLLTRGSLLSG
jgi:hypothetical protein